MSESEVAQLCPTLCNPVDCSLPGFSVHGILQARILEWVIVSFSGDLPDPGTEPGSPALRADAVTSEPPGKPEHHNWRIAVPAHANRGKSPHSNEDPAQPKQINEQLVF